MAASQNKILNLYQDEPNELVAEITITCRQGNGDEKLNVNMSYDGDEDVICYLLESARYNISKED
jgi:hypothetical protein